MGVGKWPRILKLRHNTYILSGPDFLFLSPFLCHVTLKLAVSRSWLPVPYGANLFDWPSTLSLLQVGYSLLKEKRTFSIIAAANQ